MIVSITLDTEETTIPEALFEIQTMYCGRGTIDVHSTISRRECIFSFTDDTDAAIAYAAIKETFTAITSSGAFLKYKQWHPANELGIDLATWHLVVSIIDLPLQLWMKDAVEYILSPFCALEFTNHSTSTLEDLSSYKCVIWCQDISAIPSTILLHRPSEKHKASCRGDDRGATTGQHSAHKVSKYLYGGSTACNCTESL